MTAPSPARPFSFARVRTAMLAVLTILALAAPALSASSERAVNERVSAALVSAEDAITPEAARVSAGLHLDLQGDWKSYWRTPGEVGLAPQIDWSNSQNVASVDMLYPAPTRFRAFGIENYGYKDEVVLPLEIALERPGEAASLRADVNLLVCEQICVPEAFTLALDLPAGDAVAVDRDASALIARFARKVPTVEGASANAAITNGTLRIRVEAADPFVAPDVFPEFEGGAFGAPMLALGPNGDVWADLPVLREPTARSGLITVHDGALATEVPVTLAATLPPIPAAATRIAAVGDTAGEGLGASILAILGLAFLGGLILNAMPCVLPVLSLKVAGAVRHADGNAASVRASFLATAAGILAFAWALAVVLLAVRAAGGAIGWGVQFQSPLFLSLVVILLILFAMNLMGGFEINLPERWNGAMARGGASGRMGDFVTGAFAALLATPCSAPFLGTAVAFAFAGTALELFAVFSALGSGLAAPYLLVAAAPRTVRVLPKPGPWMAQLRFVLGLMLFAAAAWFASILAVSIGWSSAMLVVGMALWVGGYLGFGMGRIGTALTIGFAAFVLSSALLKSDEIGPEPIVADAGEHWQAFDRALIAPAVARGEVVLVDVTADWCLTCKANKASTLDTASVEARIAAADVLALRADWTQPNDAIRRYLEANGRYGIPFNAVYGPNAPEGIALSEVLTPSAVLDAIERAGG